MKPNSWSMRIPTLTLAATLGCLAHLELELQAAAANDSPASLERLFTLKVKPLLEEKCQGCHGDPTQEIKGGLDVTSRATLLKGGVDYPNPVVPGHPEQGVFMTAVRWEDPDLEMPPKENDRLSTEQVEQLERWIRGGAPWPDASRQAEIRAEEKERKVTEDGELVPTSGGLSEAWTFRRYAPEDLWAWRPLLPERKDFRGHVVDQGLQDRWKAEGVKPAPRANGRALVRRVFYDLIGLPPSPEEVEAFFQQQSENPEKAWQDLVESLLASPHYGERWAQHWLDVARYADTGGYSNDYERSNMWRYRDYVIRAFNEDKPYNQFVMEQLAGDELADASLRERVPDEATYLKARTNGDYLPMEAEWLVASGFLRLGPWDPAMVKNPEARQLYLDDVVNAVGQTFLSTALRCAKCHDHKFDPIPTRDYYRIYAAFSTTQLAERQAPFLPEENLDGMEAGKEDVERLLEFARERVQGLKNKQETAARAWYREHGLPYVPEAERKNLPDEMKPPRHVGLDITDQGRLKVREQDEWIWERRLERYEPMVQSVYNGPVPSFLNARKLRIKSGGGKLPEDTIYLGGALEAPGENLTPGVLSPLGIPSGVGSEKDPYALPQTEGGRRLALAKWIADTQNPLAARSIVNRVWQHHFGQPLAGNPNNFGAKGAKPTHPQLLDALARELITHDWSLKHLHRVILTSEAYRMSSRHPDAAQLAQMDPDNQMLAYFPPRRLTAEEIRDAMLKVSGEWNPEMGGVPVSPEIHMEVALQPRMIQFSLAPAYQASRTPAERNRRTIYAYRVRGLADPFLEVLNQPNPNDSCEMRDATAVSPQAFALFHGEGMHHRSLAFASRVVREASNPEARIHRAFQLAYGRDASTKELDRLLRYMEDMQAYHGKVHPEPIQRPVSIVRSLVEEFSGEPFEYEEILPVYEDYTPDLEASAASVEVRALADLCLLIFNSNEFLHLD